MTNLITIIFVFILAFPVSGQGFHEPGRRDKMRDQVEQLQKIRLLEILNLEETTAVKFITRQKDHRDRMQSIMEKRKSVIDELIAKIKKNETDDDSYKSDLGAITNIEKELTSERKRYIDSLWDILSAKQIATVVTFEEQFRGEIMDMLRERKEGKNRQPL